MYGPLILHMLSASVHLTVAYSFENITNFECPGMRTFNPYPANVENMVSS